MLNSHSIAAPYYKKALCSQNISEIKKFVHETVAYLKTIQFGNRKTGQIGVILGLQNAISLFDEYVTKDKILKYIPLYKVSQYHLELYFSALRGRYGFNNSPSCY